MLKKLLITTMISGLFCVADSSAMGCPIPEEIQHAEKTVIGGGGIRYGVEFTINGVPFREDWEDGEEILAFKKEMEHKHKSYCMYKVHLPSLPEGIDSVRGFEMKKGW